MPWPAFNSTRGIRRTPWVGWLVRRSGSRLSRSETKLRPTANAHEFAECIGAWSAHMPQTRVNVPTPHPILICCVGCTHRVWGGDIPGGEDAYVREWATAGELVGVENPPRSVAELRKQIADYGPQLRGDDAARETARFIRNVPVPLAGRPAYAVLFAGAVSTLPQEHRRMLGVPDLPMAVTRPAVSGILATLAKILGPASPSMQAAHTRVDTLAADVQAQ